jgi:hypothetical protein
VVGRSFWEAELEEALADVDLDGARLRNRRLPMPRWSGLLPRASTSPLALGEFLDPADAPPR